VMQIIIMRFTSLERGWRTILTVAPTVIVLLYILIAQPYYHLSKNAFISVTYLIYLFERFTGEIGIHYVIKKII
jgi:hypothetical protein